MLRQKWNAVQHIVVDEATRVRNAAEKAYRKYHTDFSYGSDLCGACAYCAVELTERLKARNVKATLKVGYYNEEHSHHCWTTVDGIIVDVTATQFFMQQKVFICHPKMSTHEKYKTLYSGAKAYRELERNWFNPWDTKPFHWKHSLKEWL